MSSFEFMSRRAVLAAGFAALVGLAGCTSGPLYGTSDNGVMAPGMAVPLRGRIAVAPVDTRTSQIVRNRLIFLLNGGQAVVDPLYEARLSVKGAESGVSIEGGSGVPTAKIYNMTATYRLIRLSDGKQVARGIQSVMIPYDLPKSGGRSQRFAAERAAIDARQQAGEEAAAKVELALMAAIRREQG
ncbi:hypothetical protein [Consotaella aegiceratis]|uniref:hypothetical protein n=1 Tax=Consotaella aegiceratis TaxID=3097961 RepID=UPI002F426078